MKFISHCQPCCLIFDGKIYIFPIFLFLYNNKSDARRRFQLKPIRPHIMPKTHELVLLVLLAFEVYLEPFDLKLGYGTISLTDLVSGTCHDCTEYIIDWS